MNEKHILSIPLAIAVLALAAAGLACGRQQQGTAAPPVVLVVTATPGGPVTPLDTPAPTSTSAPGGCVDGMQFVADVTVPDGTIFSPGAAFVKTWRIRNSGTCDWSGYRIVFDHGEPMGTLDQAIVDLPAGEELDISIEMTAPGGPGSYRGYWRVQSSSGAVLGTLYCDIVVTTGESSGGGSSGNVPAAPTNLHLVGWSMNTQELAWDDNSADEQGFRIYMVGQGAVAEVGAGQTSADIPYPPCGQTVQYVVRAYNAAGESGNSNALELTGPQCAAEERTITVQSLPAEDGYIRGVTSGETVVLDGNVEVGDGTQNRARQAFFSFDISGIPQGATIQSTVLDLSGCTVRGDPFGTPGLGSLGIYFVQYGSLDPGDFVAGWPTGRVTLSGPPTIINPLTTIQSLVDSRMVRFQIRMQFQAITDNDSVADGLTCPEGGPSLTVTYRP